MKWSFVLFISFLSLATWSQTILIDPGHGGHDLGAKARSYNKNRWNIVNEKDLALQIAKRIHRHLKKKKYKTYLTRSVDRDLSLQERADLAEKIKADFFISVHINASEGATASGFETYYLDSHKDQVVSKIERTENKNLKGEDLIIDKILMDLVIERTTKSSKKMAEYIHEEIGKSVGKRYDLKDRGMKPGIFYVLALTKRPGVLLEVGFLSNKKELRKLTSPIFQENYAKAVVSGLIKYFDTQKKNVPSLF